MPAVRAKIHGQELFCVKSDQSANALNGVKSTSEPQLITGRWF